MESERAEKILNRVQDWIKSADQKVSIFLAFQGVIASLIISQIQTKMLLKLGCYSSVEVVLFISVAVLLILSCYKSILVIIPRLHKKGGQSITYFGDIAGLSLSDYKKMLNEATEEAYFNELVSQIHVSAKIAKDKHDLFRESIIIFCAGLVFLLVFVQLYVRI